MKRPPLLTVRTPRGKRLIGPGHPAFIVAEISGNHLQSFDRAARLVDAAIDAGADAVKLQTYTADTITLDSEKAPFQVRTNKVWKGRTLHKLYRSAYTPWEWQAKLKARAERRKTLLFSTPFDDTAVDFLERMGVALYKVAGYEFVDVPLLERIAKTRKPVIVSVGFPNIEQIELCLKTLRSKGARQIALLHCVTTYLSEAKLSDLNLAMIEDLARRFGVVSGFSDNNAGIDFPVMAAAAGASIIEKHLTLKRSDGGPDAQFSLEPREFKKMVDSIRRFEKARGEAAYRAKMTGPFDYYRRFRKSLFVCRDVKKGERFTKANVRSIRPGQGLEPRLLDEVLGRPAARDIKRGTPLSLPLVGRARR